jgi:NAD+ diphosphatase
MPPIRYTGSHLDRAAGQRRDDAWVASLLESPEARVVPVFEEQNLVHGFGAGTTELRAASSLIADLGDGVVGDPLTWVLLGLDGNVPLFAADVSGLDQESLTAVAGSATFVELRKIGSAVSARDAALLAYARAMMIWHRRHRYCGRCGGETASRHAGHMRLCRNASCGAETFPRTDPAVIMLVEHPASGRRPARCLLARHSRLPRGVYSTLAGFLEPGESLEEAVVREVMEETGVRVTNVTYQASQPWPFPSSLMVGFRATAEDDAIVLDRTELDEAHWFTAEQVAAFGEWDDEDATYRLPRPDSIARELVESWMGRRETGDGRREFDGARL